MDSKTAMVSACTACKRVTLMAYEVCARLQSTAACTSGLFTIGSKFAAETWSLTLVLACVCVCVGALSIFGIQNGAGA